MAASLAELSLAEKLEGEKLFAARVELATHQRALRRADSPEEYPLSLENSLSEAIASRDAARAKSLASRLLSHVLLAKERSGGGTPARLFELLTVISRAALKAGADPSYVLKRNADAMSGLMRLYGEDKRAEELSTWLSSLLDSYFAVIGEAVSPRHRELIGAVRNYLLEHYAGKVSLEDAAAVAEVTPTYLSKVFKADRAGKIPAFVVRRLSEGDRRSDRIRRSELLYQDLPAFDRRFARQIPQERGSHFRMTGLFPVVFRLPFVSYRFFAE